MFISNIPPGVASHVRDGYRYFTEVPGDFDWKAFVAWGEANLPKYPVQGENCMGQKTEDMRTSWCSCWKEDVPGCPKYLGFKTEAERTAFLKAFPQAIVPELYKNPLYWHQ